jgi:hypothetical protein
MVNGSVYPVRITDTARLTRNRIASSTAESICSGPGTNPQNRPTAAPPATDLRFRCHRPG